MNLNLCLTSIREFEGHGVSVVWLLWVTLVETKLIDWLIYLSTYFQYNGKHYKQMRGTAMRSPVSVVLSQKLWCNRLWKRPYNLPTSDTLWLRYVDDIFTAVYKDEIDAFHDYLNKQNGDIQFTKEVEENGKLSFLDGFSSYNPTDRKQYYKIKCFDCRLPTLVWLTEPFTRDWLKTNEPREMFMLILTSLYIINWQATTLPGTLPNS